MACYLIQFIEISNKKFLNKRTDTSKRNLIYIATLLQDIIDDDKYNWMTYLLTHCSGVQPNCSDQIQEMSNV